jgi:cytochrome P450
MDFPWPNRPGVELDPEYLKTLRERPLIPVELAGGRPALLVTGHADVRAVLSDDRFSREAWSHGTLFARESGSLALSASDPPTHTRRRKAVQRWFTHRAAEAARPRIEQLAEQFLDHLQAAGTPANPSPISASPSPTASSATCSPSPSATSSSSSPG